MRRASQVAIAILFAGGVVAAGVALRTAGRHDIQRPAGSDAAFKTFERELPHAKLLSVEAPKDFGLQAADGKPLFWTFRYRLDGADRDVPITPLGLIVRLRQPIDNPPDAVLRGLLKEAPGAKVLTKEVEEIRATLKFVPIAKPAVYYIVAAEQGGKSHQVVVQSDGRVSSSTVMSAGGETGEKDEEAAATTAKEMKVPKEQALAVKATKAAYPGAVVTAVEVVGYDDGSGEMGVLYYEVEFPWHGHVKEAHATPDGYMLDQDRAVAVSELPSAVTKAVDSKLPNAHITKATAMEDHAGPEFVALSHPKKVYVFGIEANGKKSTLRLTPTGKKIRAFMPGG